MYFHYKNTYVCFERLRDYKKIGSHNSNIRRQYMQKFIRTPKYIKFSGLLASIDRILQNFPNYNVLINNFDNFSSNSIICDDLKQKKLHTLSNY